MTKSKAYYDEFMKLFKRYEINLFCCHIRGMDSGELCFDYSDENGYLLYSYDRGSRNLGSKLDNWDDLILRLLNHHCSNVIWQEYRADLKPEEKTDEYRVNCRMVEFEKVLVLLNDFNRELLISEVSHFESRLNIVNYSKQYRYNIYDLKFELSD